MNLDTKTLLESSDILSDEDILLLGKGEDTFGTIVENWPLGTFEDALGDRARAFIAHSLVAQAKLGAAPELGAPTTMPDFPPYLQRGTDGKPMGYDPHDGSQYWTDPDTGEHWRWDGKGRGDPAKGAPARRNSLGETVRESDWPFGQPHRVVLVPHDTVNGVPVPRVQEMHDANSQGADWFHRGYKCWVGLGGKLYSDVTPVQRQRVLAALNARPPAQDRFIVRSPQAA